MRHKVCDLLQLYMHHVTNWDNARDIIGGIKQLEGINKITYTKYSEFCWT